MINLSFQNDELKRRLAELEADKRSSLFQLENWKKEKQMLVKKIEMVSGLSR